jgi:hypothetical protein
MGGGSAMKLMFVTLLVVAVLTRSSFGLSPITSQACRGGGGGPVPLFDISHKFTQGHSKIETVGSVSEYLYWESRNTLVYRNPHNELYLKPLKSDSNFLTYLYSPISRLIDPREKYLMVAQDTKYLDISEPHLMWHSYSTKYPVSRHLFWGNENGRDVLYSLSNLYRPKECIQTLIIYRYGTGEHKPSSCSLKATAEEQFFIGEGHSYPYAILYKTTPDKKGGTNLFLYSVDVRRALENGSDEGLPKCVLTPLFPPSVGSSISVPGNVKAVYHLPNQNGILQPFSSFAIKTDDPTENLLWLYRKTGISALRCESFNFNGREAFVLNTNRSIITTWAPEEGAKIVLPELKEEAQIFRGLSATNLSEDDFWLANNGNLFVSTTDEINSGKKLYLTDLDR